MDILLLLVAYAFVGYIMTAPIGTISFKVGRTHLPSWWVHLTLTLFWPWSLISYFALQIEPNE